MMRGMKNRKKRKLAIKRRSNRKKQSHASRPKKNRREQRRSKARKPIRARGRRSITDPRVARAFGFMRREGLSASTAARREGMKLETFRKGAGSYLYRSGPGKPWKVRSKDQLRFAMTVRTSRGPLDVIVSNSRERKLLHDYEVALRMFRAGADGAEAALKAFEGKKVGGHTLITDIKLLIELEEAGQLDFEGLYAAVGAHS
jgi:hypothetical protein